MIEKKQLQHLAQVRILAIAANRKKREYELGKIKQKVSEEIKTYPIQDVRFLKSMLAALYWSGGGKYNGSPINFANTDPKLSKLFISLLRKCYPIDENKFRVRLHLHYYHHPKQLKVFWSKLLNIPPDKFGKIYFKKRSKTKKFRKNFNGICFIKYYDTKLRQEIMELAYKLHDNIT